MKFEVVISVVISSLTVFLFTGQPTELESVPGNLSTTPLPTNTDFNRLFSATSSVPDSSTGVRQPSYVNLPTSDPVKLKVTSSLQQGGGDVSINSALQSSSLAMKNPTLAQQISCEESLRFGAEGGVDIIEKSRQQDASVAKQKQLILELQAKVASLEKRVGENVQSMSRMKLKIQEQEDELSLLAGRTCNGVYVWKIHEFARLRREALIGKTTVLHSKGFYTSFYGYKLCIRVNLNGVEKGNSSHISIFVHFMRGEYDDILTWPFRGKIVLSIMDQSELKQHITEVLESKPNLAAFQRPQNNRNHKGFGYIEFAPVSMIESSNPHSSSYIMNDTLILKAEVTETEL